MAHSTTGLQASNGYYAHGIDQRGDITTETIIHQTAYDNLTIEPVL